MIVMAQEASSGTFQRPRWEPGEAAARTPRAGHNPLRFGIDTGLWFANWSTRVDTPTSPHKTSSGPVVFLAPRIDMDLSPDWRGTLRFEIGEASDLSTKVVAFRRGAMYVQTDEPGAHYTACLEKPRLLKRLNAGCDRDATVHDIVIRAGDI